MNTTILTTTKQALEALDFSGEIAEFEKVEAEVAEIAAAQDKIRARTEAIDIQVREERINAAQIADRLLAGEDFADATAGASIDALKEERAMLNEAFRDLSRRYADTYPRLGHIRSRARSIAARETTTLIDAILADAREAALKIAECYAAAYGVTGTTGTHSPGKDALGDALNGLSALFHQTGGAPGAQVPAAIRDAMMPLVEKGKILRTSVPTYVPGLSQPPAQQSAEPRRKAPGDDGKPKSRLIPAWARATDFAPFAS